MHYISVWHVRYICFHFFKLNIVHKIYEVPVNQSSMCELRGESPMRLLLMSANTHTSLRNKQTRGHVCNMLKMEYISNNEKVAMNPFTVDTLNVNSASGACLYDRFPFLCFMPRIYTAIRWNALVRLSSLRRGYYLTWTTGPTSGLYMILWFI